MPRGGLLKGPTHSKLSPCGVVAKGVSGLFLGRTDSGYETFATIEPLQ
jgi:hypothetical protein